MIADAKDISALVVFLCELSNRRTAAPSLRLDGNPIEPIVLQILLNALRTTKGILHSPCHLVQSVKHFEPFLSRGGTDSPDMAVTALVDVGLKILKIVVIDVDLLTSNF